MLMKMASFLSRIWILQFTCVTSFFYQHTMFHKYIHPANDNEVTIPIFSSTGFNFHACINKCHNQPSCESLVYDTSTLNCSLHEEKSKEEDISRNQVLYEVVNNAIFYDISGFSNYLCNGISPGYIYNETVPVCYKISSEPRSVTDAVLFCGESEGHLLRIDTEQKQKFAEDLKLEKTSTVSKYRIDGILTDAIWTFSNGRPITRFHWCPGEPSNNRSSIGLRVSGKWDDIKPLGKHGCICEKDIKCH